MSFRSVLIDHARVERMISAALNGANEAMEEMSNRLQEPMDYFASRLLGHETPDEDEGDLPGYPCPEDWREFTELCRKAADEYYNRNNFASVTTEHGKETVSRVGRIGLWPTWIPKDADAQPKRRCDAAWAYAWWLDKKATTDFLSLGFAPRFYPAATRDGMCVASGLLLAIQAGLVTVSAERTIPFVLRYEEWYKNVGTEEASTSSLCALLRISVAKMTVGELQTLATVWEGASAELARRGISLVLPAVQKWDGWRRAYMDSIHVPETVDEAAEVFVGTDDPCVRYRIQWIHHQMDRTGVQDPADPFGERIYKLDLRIRQLGGDEKVKVKYPSYEDCVASMLRRRTS